MAGLKSKSEMTLKWDYSADPIWIDGEDVETKHVIRDEKKIKEIERWYEKFSKAEEKLHEDDLPYVKSKPTDDEIEKTVILMKEKLVPEGTRLARDIGASLKVDWGHSKRVRKIVSKVLGIKIEDAQTYS